MQSSTSFSVKAFLLLLLVLVSFSKYQTLAEASTSSSHVRCRTSRRASDAVGSRSPLQATMPVQQHDLLKTSPSVADSHSQSRRTKIHHRGPTAFLLQRTNPPSTGFADTTSSFAFSVLDDSNKTSRMSLKPFSES
mmetsp:Transcript_21927/g.39112  ORF Transcript_21927/g.39112 Transcript_21927/m.39112 type:complete len:136 (+) Transcript_21927:59-466(+)